MALSNNEVIKRLEKTKCTLQDQCDDVEGEQFKCLCRVIATLKTEIGAIEQKNLASANYSPISDAFKKATAEGKKFQNDIDKVKQSFEAIESIGAELDKIINIITSF
ncbi:MAG TPA: hypothetical protein VFT64_04930 [Rickettsiales bacterium]|nr:hypothetical protein [Rickettsiales bacterium]